MGSAARRILELDELLEDEADDVSKAYVHGIAIGAAVGLGDSDAGALNVCLQRVLADQLDRAALALFVVASLDDDDGLFEPALPDDDADLEERLLALKEWASGFLAGFADGFGQRDPTERARVERPAEVGSDEEKDPTAEILGDLVALAELDPVETDYEDDDRSDDPEADYVELVEYIRATVHVLREERRVVA